MKPRGLGPPDTINLPLIKQLLGQLVGGVKGAFGPATYSYSYEDEKSPAYKSNLPVQAPTTETIAAQSIPQPQMPSSSQPNNTAIDREALAQRIAQKWGKDTPVLQNLDLLLEAGNKLPSNMDKLLPIILALRETQGGKYNKGNNNPFNIRNNQSKFQDYPDLATAVLGNLDKGGESSGLVGLLQGAEPSNQSIYADFRRTGDIKDLYKKWSPPEDSNGALEEQLQNYQWFKNYLEGSI
jgi:hypothetical protein